MTEGRRIPNDDVTMVRPHLDKILSCSAPPPYTLRQYQVGDEERWRVIQKAADEFNDINNTLFRKEFGWDDDEIAKRMWFLCDEDGTAIGTSTAWFDDTFEGERWGQVHWVAVVPKHQGKGLSKPLITQTLRTIRELGDERAFLYTSTGRVPAIKLYRQFGFAPLKTTDADRRAWARIRGAL